MLVLAVVAAVAVAVAATLLLTRHGSGDEADGAGAVSRPASAGIASADDTGPVGVITEEPTCAKWVETSTAFARKLSAWGKRDASVPATSWSVEQREMYESAARLLRTQADQVVDLARQTPHRVMRELYEQLSAYNRAYADAIPTYQPGDDKLALTGNNFAASLNYICEAITNLSASDRAGLVPAPSPPSAVPPVGDPANPQRFLITSSPACPPLRSLGDRVNIAIADWLKLPRVDFTNWSPADKLVWESAAQTLTLDADETEQLGRSSGNPIVEDFLVLAAQYQRAFVKAIPSYTIPDSSLYRAAVYVSGSVSSACDAA